MAKKQLGAIRPDLIDRVDEVRGDVPRIRWVERAIEDALDVETVRESGRRTVRVHGAALERLAEGPAAPDVRDVKSPADVEHLVREAEKVGLVKAPSGGEPADAGKTHYYVCRRGCDFGAKSSKARCPHCNGAVV